MSADVEMGTVSQNNNNSNGNENTPPFKEPFEGIPLDQITMEYCLQHQDDVKAFLDMVNQLERRTVYASVLITFLYRHDLVLWLPFTSLICYSTRDTFDTLMWILFGWFMAIGILCTLMLDIIMLLFHLLLVPFRLLALPFCRDEAVIDVLLWSLFILKWRPKIGLRCLRSHLAFYRAYGKQAFEDYQNTRYYNNWMTLEMDDRIFDLAETVPEVKSLWFKPHSETWYLPNVTIIIWKKDPWKKERRERRKARKQRQKEAKKAAKQSSPA